METRSPSALAAEWIENWSTPEGSALGPIEASVLDWALPREQPELCLAAIVEVLRRLESSSSNQLLGVLAAGPLEDLLNHNGNAVMEEVDLLARQDPEFRLLLDGVWGHAINPEILAKLAKYRSNPW